MEKPSSETCTVLIVAAGTGARLGGALPKQYQDLGGKAVLCRTVEAFLTMECVSGVRVVIHPDHKDLYAKALCSLDLPEPVIGGSTRQKSVQNGLSALTLQPGEIVLIHDAARPFIDAASVERLLGAMTTHRAATLACPLVETTVHSANGFIDPARPIERGAAWSIQTPQAFRYGDIRRAHEECGDHENATDDTSLTHRVGIQTALVHGSRRNIKITTQEDLELARMIIAGRTETRVGTGFDVHAFSDWKSETIRLCGIDIPHERALEGHSDADVGLHALTDALLGAAGEHDIGVHFPPSDPQWRGADSARFLSHALETVRAKGGRVINVDITVICERPKLGPHRTAMRERVAGILGISPFRVNIKGTTTERLGFTGRGEGIAAQASATIELPANEDT